MKQKQRFGMVGDIEFLVVYTLLNYELHLIKSYHEWFCPRKIETRNFRR